MRSAPYFFSIQSSGHKTIFQQLREIMPLYLGRNKVTLWEYFDQAIYNDRLYPNKNLSHFGGWWLKEFIHSRLNNIRWEGMVTDKLVLYSLFKQFGLPHPPVIAVACKRARYYGEIPVFNDAFKLAEFLRQSSTPYPLFCKPVKGSYGRDVVRIEGFDHLSDNLILHDGSTLPVMEFLYGLEDRDNWGFLFQEAVSPHPDTKYICGEGISGCRVVMLLADNKATPFRIVWKIPAGNNIVDNFSGGEFGNMAADVDVEKGTVTRVVSGKGVNLALNRPHPDSNYQLLGTQIPDWEQMMETLRNAAKCFPGFRWQHWDVGITSKGPVLLELNSAGNTDLVQMASGKGIYNNHLRSFIQQYTRPRNRRAKVFDTPPPSE